MDNWEKPVREDRFRHKHRQNPSFSSTLLDAIYRSIDEEELIFYKETMRKKHSNGFKGDERIATLQKACMIEKWMEEKVSYEKVAVRRKSVGDFDKNAPKDFDPKPPPMLLNSSSSSSESSCGGGFSSSESESTYGLSSSRSSSICAMQRPKPIRTSVSARPERYERCVDEISMYHHERKYSNYAPTQKPKHEGSFGKTKSRALKFYGDLKKVKQPISPGGRLASFLNSLFTAGNAKKAKISSSSVYEESKIKSEQKRWFE